MAPFIFTRILLRSAPSYQHDKELTTFDRFHGSVKLVEQQPHVQPQPIVACAAKNFRQILFDDETQDLYSHLRRQSSSASDDSAAAMADVVALASTIKSSLDATKVALPKSESFPGTQDGISLLSLKSHLLLSYLQHISFYILLKLRGERIDEGEYKSVVDQLIDLRVYLDKGVKPIESKLRYQIDKVIRAAERLDREGQLKDLDDTAKDALSYKPNPKALVLDQPETSTSNAEEANDGIYRPPRIASTLPSMLQSARAARRQPNNTLREFVDSELSAAPIAEPSIGSNIITQGKQGNSTIQSSRDRASQRERDRYEEENYIRLPSTGKQSKRNGGRTDDIYGGEDFRVLDQEVYDFHKSGGERESLVERSRKRRGQEDAFGGGADEASGSREFGIGDAAGVGKFKKRKKVLAARSKAKHGRK